MADVEAAAAPGGGAAAADPSAAVSDAELSARLRVVLQAADLSSTTERAIRKSLEEELGVSLNERKAFIRAQVEAFLLAQAPGEAAGEEEDHEEEGGAGKGKKRKTGGFPAQVLSEQMAAFMGAPEARRNEVVKRLWEHIKANSLNSGHKIRCDDTLRGLFGQATLNMFSMNKLLGKHLFRKEDLVAPADESDSGDEDEEEEEEDDDDAAPKKKAKTDKPKPKPKPKPKAKAEAAPRARPASAAAAFDPFDPYARAAKKAAKPPRAPKDPNAPKAALTPYFLFQQEERPRLLAAHPGMGFAALAKKMGQRWRSLDDGERARFEAAAAADRERAAAEMAAYKPPPPGELERAAADRSAAALTARKQLPLLLAPPLAALLGVTAQPAALSRGEATARMHAYFRDKGLLDPSDRRFVLADAPLRQLFGAERFKAFSVSAMMAPMLSRADGGAQGGGGDDEQSDDDDDDDREAEEAADAEAPLPGDRARAADDDE